MLEGVQVCLNTDFFANKKELMDQAEKVLFTGMIDEFYDYCYGELEYRSLRFETETLEMGNYQGNAVVNYTDMRCLIQESLSISILSLELSQRQ